jgi:two-component system, NtrC family, sensor histidine kinase HydH
MMPKQKFYRIAVIALMLALTLSLHYMIFPVPHWVHLFHRRLCYIPIILGSLWFGLSGGCLVALILSLAVLPLALSFPGPLIGNEELGEILFYLGIGLLTGFLVRKGERARRQKEEVERELARTERLALAGRTAAGIAHEVRTPLGAIQGAAEICGEDFPEGHPRRPFYDILVREIRRLGKVTEDFLDLSRPIVLEPARTQMVPLLEECVRAVRDRAEAGHVRLELESNASIEVRVDPQRLFQVVVNLLHNAIQLSPEGSMVRVTLDEAPGGLAIVVADEGPGLPAGEEQEIFEPFFTRRKDGTGLGLTLVRQIVTAHGGALSAENRPEGGSRFIIRLPGNPAE